MRPVYTSSTSLQHHQKVKTSVTNIDHEQNSEYPMKIDIWILLKRLS